MNNKLLTNEQINKGYQRFLDQDLQAQASVEEQTQDIADALGIELSDLRRQKIQEMLEMRATASGISELEFLIQFAVDTNEERQEILNAMKLQIARTIGIL